MFISVALLAFVGVLMELISSAPSAGPMTLAALYYHFVVPGAALSLFLVYREWSVPRVPARTRFLSLNWRLDLFTLGAIIPVAMFLIPYIQRRALLKWLTSVLLSGQRVHNAASFVPPTRIWLAFLCLPLLLVLLFNGERKHRKIRNITTAVLCGVLGLLLLAEPGHILVAGLVWFSISESLPILAVIGVIVLCRKHLDRRASRNA